MEADLLPIDAPDKADLLTGSIGELSPFHETFGYFGDGVSLQTARLPSDWQDRLIAVDNANTNGYVGLCLEIHDLLISKYDPLRALAYKIAEFVVKGWIDERNNRIVGHGWRVSYMLKEGPGKPNFSRMRRLSQFSSYTRSDRSSHTGD